MKIKSLMTSLILALPPILLCSIGARAQALASRTDAPQADFSARTQCDPSLPIRIELIPENQPLVGQTARFRLEVDSDLDPDLVLDMRVEYETPPRLQMRADLSNDPQTLAKSGRSRLRLGVIVPDEARYSIRARLIVRLMDGKTISQTAVRWIDLGAEDPPEGMIGRIVDPDGTGIRIYQGTTVRRPL